MITITQPNGDEPISACAPKILFERLWGFLVDYAIKFTADEKDAQDIVAGVFVKLLNAKRTFPTFEDGKAYLYVSVRNGCFDYLELKKKKSTLHNFPGSNQMLWTMSFSRYIGQPSPSNTCSA